MPSPCWLARLTVPMMVGAALVTSSAIAVANATDDAYLARLRTLGFAWPAEDDPDIIRVAHAICVDRLNLLDAQTRIARDIHSTLDSRKALRSGQVTSMVSLAESTYCPS